MEFLDKILAFIASAQGASVTIAIVLEFAFRMIKTEKPLSVLHVASSFIKKSAEILGKVADLLDKVLPQKLK